MTTSRLDPEEMREHVRDTLMWAVENDDLGSLKKKDIRYPAYWMLLLLDTVEAVQEWAVQLQRNRDHENEFMVMAAVEVDRLIDRVLSGEDDE